MFYLAASLSLVVHIFFVLIIFWSTATFTGVRENVLGIDLVSIVKEQDSKQSHSLPEKQIRKKNDFETSRPPEVSKSLPKRSSKPPKKVQSSQIYSEPRPSVNVKKGARPRLDQRDVKPTPTSVQQGVESNAEVDSNALVLRQGKGVTIGNSTVVLKRGSESRSMDSIAGYNFDENDFRGHYETSSGRQIIVIDARAEHGRLVLHDRKTGLTRKLKKAGYGDFIYTYGPSFDEDEPVEGSVVFLPGDEHWIHRFMWLPADESAEYPVKGRLDTLSGGGKGDVQNLFVPVRDGRYPAVILVSSGKFIPLGRFSEIARHLCGRGVVVEIIDELNSDAIRNAVQGLRKLTKVDPKRIGLWVRSYKSRKIPRIPMYAGRLGFVILTIDGPSDRLYPESVASAVPDGVPVFLGFRNVGGDWKSVLAVLQAGFQFPPHQLTVLNGSPKTLKSPEKEANWVDSVSGDFVSSISAWLDSQ